MSYQRPAFLRTAIETALAGVDEPVECIVHDDGSTDRELLKYLYTLHQQGTVSSVILNAPGVNQGTGVAMNRMFKMASGDPIIKIDQDLIFRPDWLTKTREILRDSYVGLCGMFKYELDPADWRKTIITDEMLRDLGVEPVAFPHGYSYHTHLVGSAMAIPRRVWEYLGPFEERWESYGEYWQFQKDVYAAGMFNALPDEDLVTNQGFGLGPSTVVVPNPETGQPEPSKFHALPMLVPRADWPDPQ
jgi:glycosyltransferase involved in cell wall biosynthesis